MGEDAGGDIPPVNGIFPGIFLVLCVKSNGVIEPEKFEVHLANFRPTWG